MIRVHPLTFLIYTCGFHSGFHGNCSMQDYNYYASGTSSTLPFLQVNVGGQNSKYNHNTSLSNDLDHESLSNYSFHPRSCKHVVNKTIAIVHDLVRFKANDYLATFHSERGNHECQQSGCFSSSS